MLEDTIIAVSTPPGMGGLGVVRLSGGKALAIARKMFRARKKEPFVIPVRRPVFGEVFDPAGKDALDQAFLTYFKAPHSYTREDVVELSCHGSPLILEEIVRIGARAGARPAHPGEFTLRAYANGRLDIVQAEAVNDLIRSTSLTQAKVSFRQLTGSLSRRVRRLRTSLLRLAAQVEARMEFPEETLKISPARQARALASVMSELEALVASFEAGRALREGITLAITGRTNVGKSTLFNALLDEDRAIVTPYPGTTRDYLREEMVIDGFVFHLVDMAGLGKASHPVEKKGIRKGQRIAREADGLLIVLDGSRPATAEDERLIKMFRGKKSILVVNKADLAARIDKKRVRKLSGKTALFEVSALKGTHLDKLRAEIGRSFIPSGPFRADVILHARQRDILLDLLEALAEARRLLRAGETEEVYAEELRKAISLVGRLTGEIRADELMADIFSRFCVGK
jgi:tRNA modification GTPase